MGCQGEIYNIYGVIVDAEEVRSARLKCPNIDQNPILYAINGHTVTDADLDYPDAEFFTCQESSVAGIGYGANTKPKFSIRILGHSNWMGSRHFDGKALIGYPVCNECYVDRASALPTMEEIAAMKPQLIRDIKEKLGLDIDPSDVQLYLLFDSLNG